jgi:hypothetical protein
MEEEEEEEEEECCAVFRAMGNHFSNVLCLVTLYRKLEP